MTLLDKILTRREALSRRIYASSLNKLRICHGFEVTKEMHEDSIFFIGDTHFNHGNIIKYCARPFSGAKEMNSVLIKNWNKTVSEDSEVFFLGDFAIGNSKELMSKVNGKIHWIRGNHDSVGDKMCKFEYDGYEFLLVHNPDEYVGKFDGWIIHGHKHNNNLLRYPFINVRNKTINVSVETLGYRPISIQELLKYMRIAEKKKSNILVKWGI